jgi:ABC-type transport system involved in multi-copper enzyme maturation permease subunit
VAYVVFLCTIPAGERDAGLLDLMLASPLQRHQYLTATLINLLLAALALPGCLLLGVVLGLAVVDSPKALPWTRYAPCAVGMAAMILAWGGLALLLTTVTRRRGTAIAQMVAAIVTTYLVHVLAAFSSSMVWVSRASPFSYFAPIRWAVQQQPYVVDICVLLGVFVVTTLGAYRRFQTRDL